jgi:hypothetical protein
MSPGFVIFRFGAAAIALAIDPAMGRIDVGG